MVGEPAATGDDAPPTADDIGNHHWPILSNYFEGHNSHFALHHSHPGLTIQEFRLIHLGTGRQNEIEQHDARASYHMPAELPGCRDKSNVSMRRED